MLLAIILVVALILCISFSFVLINGAPYLPTLSKQIDAAIKLSGLKPGERIIELGCGDGRVLLAAAKAGLCGIGYELNPLLYVVAKLRLWPYRQQIQVKWGDFWRQQWPRADAIYVFLLPRLMAKLEQNILSRPNAPNKVISFAFKFPGRKADKEKAGVFLYYLK
jgi:hypothetical protein